MKKLIFIVMLVLSFSLFFVACASDPAPAAPVEAAADYYAADYEGEDADAADDVEGEVAED